MNDTTKIILTILCATGIFVISQWKTEKIKELEQEVQSLKENEVADKYNSKFITPQPNEPIEIGKVGNRTFFLAKIDDKECINVIGLNMGSYFICGDEPKPNK